MFGDRYFGPRYFGNRYFGPVADGGSPAPPSGEGGVGLRGRRRRWHRGTMMVIVSLFGAAIIQVAVFTFIREST